MKPLTKSEQYVLEVIKANEGVQNEEAKLIEAVWLSQGWQEDKSLYWNLTRVMHSETVSRCRRKLHEYGLITYSDKAFKNRYSAFKSEQERHGSHYERTATIVQPKPKYHLVTEDGEQFMRTA